jgi:hypothetical protein
VRSASTAETSAWQIEVAELHLVFKPLPIADAGAEPAVTHRATQDELVRLLQNQLEDMRQERDRWHASSDQWRSAFEASEAKMTRLLPPPDEVRNPTGTRLQRAWRWMQKTA